MGERDQELDDLEEELRTPYIETPARVDEGSGQTCFLNQDRQCMPDCTSYNVHVDIPQGPERCILLVYAANCAVNTQELVQLSRKMVGQAKTQAADEARAAIAGAPIPNPYGESR